MRIRLQDIAEDLNLSKMTISRVLRGQTDVSAETKARVLQRMQELNYRPNVSARGLRTGQAFRVGVIVPRIQDAFCAAICEGLISVLQPAGYGVGISTTEGYPEREEGELELHLSRQVDALFLTGPGNGDSFSEAIGDLGVPAFLLGRKAPGQSGGYVIGYNESETGRLPAEYLLASGAKRIAYLRGPRTIVGDERFAGFLKAHREAGIAPRHEWVRGTRGNLSDYQSALETVATLLRERVPPDAVMANTDALAAGARDAAITHGLDVPGAFQVIGCGDDRQVCSIGLPLSSVACDGKDLGIRAARLALKVIGSACAGQARRIRMNPAVVPRATTRQESKAHRGKGKQG